MPKFGRRSRTNLHTAHPDLQKLFNEVVKYFDCTVICGHRNEESQNKAFHEGFSKVKFPKGRHNAQPSKAVDVCPYPVDWKDLDRFRYFAGFVLGIASQMDIKIRWGGDWDMDTFTKDNKFNDLPHFELKDDS